MEAAGHQGRRRRASSGSRRSSPRGWTAIEAEIYALAGREFNIGSGPQLRQVLFDELKLPSLQEDPRRRAEHRRRRSWRSWPRKHPLPRLLIQHRQLAKLKSTYLDALPALVHPEDGRVHASFNQVVAATGRLSSSDPNLQNIPVRTEDGRQIRQAFVAGLRGLVAPDGRLLADRAADPGPLLGRPGADAGLRRGPRHPPRGRRPDLRRARVGRRLGRAAGGQDGQLRRDLRPQPVRPGRPPGDHAGRGRGVHRRLLPGIRRASTPSSRGPSKPALATGRVETILGRRRPINGHQDRRPGASATWPSGPPSTP